MLKNKVVFLTGGSKGLGRATAFELAKKNAQLALVARDRKTLQKNCFGG